MVAFALPLLFAAGLARAGPPDRTADADHEVLADEWMLVLLQGEPAGHAHSTAVREGDIVRLEMREIIRISRFGATLEVEVGIATRETADGELLSFTMRQKGAVNPVEIEGKVEAGKLNLVSKTMGMERTHSLDWPEGTLFGYAQDRYVCAQRRLPGTSFSFKTYNPELMKIVEVTYEVGPAQEIDVLGKKVLANRTAVKGLYPGITPIEWRDAEGAVWKAETGIAGLSIAMLRTSREEALLRSARPGSFDAATGLAVRVQAEIPRPRLVTTALYRLRLEGGGTFDGLALDGPGHEAKREADGSVLLRVRSVRPDPKRTLPLPVRLPARDAALKKYLDASTYVQSDDAEIMRVAREAAEGGRTSYEVAKELERWVARNVTNKGYGTCFATASEVMRDRAGDCSEHAVLLCALLRAAGIPSRGAMGVVYAELPMQGSAFWYHMWSEAYLGEWVPLDAAFPARAVDAMHIRLASTDLAGMAPAADAVEILQILGRLEIEVVEHGRGSRVRQTGARTAIDGRRYRDLDEGVSFEIPEGWEVLRYGHKRLVEKGALAALVLHRELDETGEGAGEAERIVLFARATPPGRPLAEEVDRMTARYTVTERSTVRLPAPGRGEATKRGAGGLEAVRVAYEAGGLRREGIAVRRGGVIYLLRLEPVTKAGSEALSETARSFRFE